MALVETRLFIRQMAQPYPAGKVGVSLWGVEDVEHRQRKEREEYERLIAMDEGNKIMEVDKEPEAEAEDEVEDAEMDEFERMYAEIGEDELAGLDEMETS